MIRITWTEGRLQFEVTVRMADIIDDVIAMGDFARLVMAAVRFEGTFAWID